MPGFAFQLGACTVHTRLPFTLVAVGMSVKDGHRRHSTIDPDRRRRRETLNSSSCPWCGVPNWGTKLRFRLQSIMAPFKVEKENDVLLRSRSGAVQKS